MKTTKRNLTPSELAELKQQKARLEKNALNTSIVVGIVVFFGLFLLLFVLETFGITLPATYTKPALVGLSVLGAAIHFFKKLRKLNMQAIANKKITRYTFTITDYHVESVSNTEYALYACKTTENKTVVFLTAELPAGMLLDTLEIDVLNGQIMSVKNYSTGKTVNQVILGKQLVDNYGDAFYLLDTDIQNL